MASADPLTARPGVDADGGRHVSGSTIWNIVHLVRQEAGHGGVEAMLARSGERRPLSEIEDVDGWSSFEQTRRLLEAASAVLGDPRAAERVGTVTARDDMTSEVVALLRSLGSPGELMRHIRQAAAKFCTVVDMEAVEIGDDSALVEAHSVDGFPRYEMLCHFTRGLLAQAPVPFDLPPASVEELECETRGHARCLFRVSWRAEDGGGDSAVELRLIEARLESLQATVVDLVSASDADELLQRIIERASAAVRAPRHVLAVSLDGDLDVVSSGCSEGDAQEIAAEIMQATPDERGGARLVVDVRSGHRHYGRLAAVYEDGLQFFPAERLLLATYGRLAAVALDAITSLDRSRRDEARATALLHLASALSNTTTATTVCDVIADHLLELIGCQAAAVSLFEGEELCVEAVRGLDEGETLDFLRTLRVRVADNESLQAMLAEPRPRLADRDNATPFVAGLMALSGAAHLASVPITSNGDVVGLVTAAFVADVVPTADLVQRLEGVAGLAATAVTKAHLVERVQRQAMVDDLTGLPNRRLLEDRIAQALARWQRHGEPFALCFLDLDRFKHVNDELGHASGDDILVEAGRRLQRVLRNGDTVARFGGDEYVLVLPGVATDADAEGVAEKVVGALQQPFDLNGHPIYVSASLGFAMAPTHGTDHTTLLKNADLAMYRSKRAAERWTVYRPEIRDSQPRRATLESELRRALAEDGLVVHYQPQIDIRTNTMVAVEALVRWEQPDRGLVPPDEFIPLAEESGLIVDLDTWVMRHAAAQAAEWNRAGHRLRMGVNLAGQTLLSKTLGDSVMDALSETGLPAHRLELEVTERAVHDESRRLVLALEALEATGARLAIDDFGTGHSGLSRLHQFPFDVVKIDRSFVWDVTEEHQQSPLLAAMIALAHQLHLDVIAEGVETRAQEQFLRGHGCHLAQGYYFSRPVPAEQIEALLRGAPTPA